MTKINYSWLSLCPLKTGKTPGGFSSEHKHEKSSAQCYSVGWYKIACILMYYKSCLNGCKLAIFDVLWQQVILVHYIRLYTTCLLPSLPWLRIQPQWQSNPWRARFQFAASDLHNLKESFRRYLNSIGIGERINNLWYVI